MQQAREPVAEKAVEVVQNHEDGTSSEERSSRAHARVGSDAGARAEWTPPVMSAEG
jgi:hypothetical protein